MSSAKDTHYPECWKAHPACAHEHIDELRAALAELLADYETINPKYRNNELTEAAHTALRH